MILVKVELHGAVTMKVRTLGVLKICNDATSQQTTKVNYTFELRGARGQVLDTGVLRGFPRRRLLAWDLVYRALRACRGDRNGDVVTEGQQPGWERSLDERIAAEARRLQDERLGLPLSEALGKMTEEEREDRIAASRRPATRTDRGGPGV